MTKVTYIPAPNENQREPTTCHGIRFKPNVTIDISPDRTVDQLVSKKRETDDGERRTSYVEKMKLVKLLATNPQFRVEGEEQAVQKTPQRIPESAEEMVEHTLNWIKATADVGALDDLWAREQTMRDETGVVDGSAYMDKVATAFELRRAVVKRSTHRAGLQPGPDLNRAASGPAPQRNEQRPAR